MLALRDIMRTDVVTLDPELSLRDAMELFADRHISGAPVVAGGKVVGVISVSDLITFAASNPPVPAERDDQVEWGEWEAPATWTEGDEAAGTFFSDLWTDAGADVEERFSQVTGPEWDRFAEHTVAEAMTRRVRALASATPVEVAADVMRRNGIHRVHVMDDSALRGIVTTSDITRAVADHKLTARTYVFSKESRPRTHGWP